MKKWLISNWDKLIIGVFSTIVAGITGFFSALASQQAHMARMSERITSLETELRSAVVPKLATIDANDNRIRAAETEIIRLKNQNDSMRRLAISSNQRRESKRYSPVSASPSLPNKLSQP